ncbi:alpha/beta fold hydrolase [Variovorax sp. NFACC27]|uniref:alpha/beta fold hydrolase n=1 Tax=unclassified Variovorax TaxID=663243 RepID=UPI000895B331|nr:Pimeloyl-ACP methyl ester carboxylesterase [Variovorax sp. NFACC28]SEG91811.1 Pimeloyl-ACP methyl ester carboxylesterase [Variovorax sp. NFACC29]SFD52019.1 Pimeloyl-ACP methyl ester carboxylesterase [Variovorax sp. NFACC26]SFG71176.1 Pimeloyl-ACP methyl ester carboxylesterase [Variovorax sp. NFACC27]
MNADLIARIDALSTHHDPVHEGVRVRWRRFGTDTSRPPLVLLHGGHGSWMHWLRNAEALSAGRTLWLPDMPGFNESDAPPRVAPGEDSLKPLLAALGGTLDQLIGAGTVIDLGGFSFGGLTAARFGAGRGAVRRLALIGSGGHGTLRRMTAQMINWRAAPDREAERAALLNNLAALMLHDPAAIDALAFEIHDISCHGTRFRSKEVSQSGGLQQALGTLNVPTLLLWGEFDVTADPRPLVAQLATEGPAREGVVVDGAGHWAQYERADEVNARLVDFFR